METTTLKSSKAPTPPPPTSKTVHDEDDVETVSFTVSLSATNDVDSPAEEAPKKKQKVEPKTTTEQETKITTTTAAAAEDRRGEVKQTRHDSPRNSPDGVIKPDDSDAGETKTSTKKKTKTAIKSSKAEATHGGENPDAVSGKTNKAAAVTEEKVVVQAETLKTSAAISENAANAVTTLTSAAETVEDDDDVETVSFTLSLSVVDTDESPAEKTPEKEPKVESKTTTSQETKSTTTAAAAIDERRVDVKQTRHDGPENSSDVAIKPDDSDVGETKKKTSTKKTTKTATKASKAEDMNGAEKLDAVSGKTDKAVVVKEEKIEVHAEPPNTSASLSEDTINAVNGETKTATKTVKKKTKKASGDTITAASTDAVVEEKSVTKEIITKTQAVTNTESSKMPTTNTVDDTSSVINGDTKSTAKTTKKKTTKKAATESEAIPVAEEKEVSRTENKAVVKEKQEVPNEKSEPVKAEDSTANEATITVTEATKKKTKKVASDASSKSSAAQEDATIPVASFTANENSPKEADNAAKPTNLQESGDTITAASTEAGKSAVDTVKTAQETTAAAVPETTTSDKVIAKKKKPKKAASSAAESSETVFGKETDHSSVSNANIDVTLAADDLSEKAPQDVTVITDNTVAEPAADISAALSKEKSSADDIKKSPSPVVPLIATTDETELSNIVTLIQVGDTGNDASTEKTTASTETFSSAGDASEETKHEIFKPTVTSTDASVDALATDVSAKDSKNEESDFSYRRKSMDDFIKRILAEAREEQQKRMATTTNSGSDTTNLMDLESTANDLDKLSPTNKEASMLDRRLASTDRKRTQKEEFGEWTSKNTSEEVDLDHDLAEIGRYFGKRNPTGTSKYDVEMEMNGEWSSSRVRDIRQLDVDSGQDSRRPQQNGVSEDSFVPHAREETAELVRNSSRPVRAIIDQQSDVIQLLKTTARGVDDLESEIRSIRATFLDRQARIETVRSAVDAEVRAYQADQQAANERIQQQQIPGGHFVRDEFMRANNIASSHRSSAIDELLGGASPRRRCGSVSSTSGIVSGTLPSGMSSNDLDYKSSALNSWILGTRSSVVDQPRRNDVDDDASSTASGYSITRSRRGGSIARERTYMTEDMMGPRMDISRSYLLPTYDNSSPSMYSFGETSVGSTTAYAPQTSSSTRSYYQTDYGPTSAAATSLYGGTDTRGYYGGDSRSYGYSSYGSTATHDPSRFRRAQSVSDFASERSASNDRAYNSAYSSPAGQFQSRFLEKVRARKSYGDDQYRSRFLASDSGASRYYSSRRNYSSND